MATEPAFVAWLQQVRGEVDAVRASAKPADRKGAKPDKRLDGVLPMQFEHDGTLRWSTDAHRATMWSALSELGLYLCGLLGFVCLLLSAWIPLWVWIGLASVFVLMWLVHRYYHWREQPARRWLEQAEVVPGALVYANEVLFKPGPEPAANAGFVITFDAALAADPERLQAVASRCFDLHRPATVATPAERELQRRCIAWSQDRTPENPHVFDRVQVPRSTCGNDATFVVAVAVDRRSLPGGVIDRRLFPLLARRDRNEAADLVPASLWERRASSLLVAAQR